MSKERQLPGKPGDLNKNPGTHIKGRRRESTPVLFSDLMQVLWDVHPCTHTKKYFLLLLKIKFFPCKQIHLGNIMLLLTRSFKNRTGTWPSCSTRVRTQRDQVQTAEIPTHQLWVRQHPQQPSYATGLSGHQPMNDCDKECDVYTMAFYSAVRKNQIMSCAGKWMEPGAPHVKRKKPDAERFESPCRMQKKTQKYKTGQWNR